MTVGRQITLLTAQNAHLAAVIAQLELINERHLQTLYANGGNVPTDHTAATAALEQRDQQAALRVQLFGALETLEQADPDHGEFWCAAHDVASAYRAARDARAL